MAISIPRIAERSARRTRRSLAYVVPGGAFVVLVALFALSRSSAFALRHIDVAGRGHLTPERIRELSGLGPGTNVLWADTAHVEDRLLADPWIASVSVERSLPWTMRISVEQRTPIAVVDDSGIRTLVAADGTSLGPAPAGSRGPAIWVPPRAATVDAPGGIDAARFLGRLAPSVYQCVEEVDVALDGSLTVRLTAGVTVHLGDPVNLGQKAAALRRLVAWARTTGSAFDTISLVAPSAPAATLRA